MTKRSQTIKGWQGGKRGSEGTRVVVGVVVVVVVVICLVFGGVLTRSSDLGERLFVSIIRMGVVVS